ARALPLVTLVYLLTIVPVLALTDWTAWTDGAWPALAGAVVGGWLGVWVALAGMLSAFALFNALLLVYSRIPLGLAPDGLLPGLVALAALPLLLLVVGVALEVRSRAIGLPGVLVAVLLAAAGPPVYAGLRARGARASGVAP